jgi:hypothetical protein
VNKNPKGVPRMSKTLSDGDAYLRLLHEGFKKSQVEKSAGKMLPPGITYPPEETQPGIPTETVERRNPLSFLTRTEIPAMETTRGILGKGNTQESIIKTRGKK